MAGLSVKGGSIFKGIFRTSPNASRDASPNTPHHLRPAGDVSPAGRRSSSMSSAARRMSAKFDYDGSAGESSSDSLQSNEATSS